MSVAEFSTVLRTRITKAIKEKITRKSNSLKGFIGAEKDKVDALRTKLKAANYNNIILTKQGFEKLVNELRSENLDFNTYTQYMIYRRNNKSKPKSLDDLAGASLENTKSSNQSIADPWTILYSTPYNNLFAWTEDYLNLIGIPKDNIKLALGKFDAGHTLGILTFRSIVSFGSKIDVESGGIVIRGEPDLAYFDRLNQLLLDLDLAAGNSIKSDTGLYVRATKDFKDKAQFYIEMQVRENAQGTGNQQTGKLLDDLGKSLATFARATTAGNKNLNNEFLRVATSVEKILDKSRNVINQYPEALREAALANLDALVNSRGSKSLSEHIEQVVVDGLEGRKLTSTKKSYPEINIGNLEDPMKLLKVEISKLVKELRVATKKTQQELKKRKQVRIRTPKGKFISPTSIMNMLNDKLAQQIQRNMGKGNSTKLLNYRTGRFSDSARVTGIDTRSGQVTAFYTYMKNPYATFATGGAQSSPASRDPNKLISLSIRQLATDIVSSRLRVVPQ